MSDDADFAGGFDAATATLTDSRAALSAALDGGSSGESDDVDESTAPLSDAREAFSNALDGPESGNERRSAPESSDAPAPAPRHRVFSALDDDPDTADGFRSLVELYGADPAAASAALRTIDTGLPDGPLTRGDIRSAVVGHAAAREAARDLLEAAEVVEVERVGVLDVVADLSGANLAARVDLMERAKANAYDGRGRLRTPAEALRVAAKERGGVSAAGSVPADLSGAARALRAAL